MNTEDSEAERKAATMNATVASESGWSVYQTDNNDIPEGSEGSRSNPILVADRPSGATGSGELPLPLPPPPPPPQKTYVLPAPPPMPSASDADTLGASNDSGATQEYGASEAVEEGLHVMALKRYDHQFGCKKHAKRSSSTKRCTPT